MNKRSDGYHEIFSLMVPVSLYDTVLVRRKREGITLEVGGEFPVAGGADNTCVRAAELFFSHYGIQGGVHIELGKHIPSGAGLGGGSSDAAALLKALSLLYLSRIDVKEMVQLGVRVGADVPFFVKCVPSYVEGIGDVLSHVQVEERWWVVVAKPPVEISTRHAYEKLGRGTEPTRKKKRVLPKVRRLEDVAWQMENDFEEIVFREFPEVEALREEMESLGADVSLMSGTGSSVFGIFRNRDEARSAEANFRRKGYFARLVRTL